MDKFAKYSPKWKASTDPTQDKIRSAKANWNGISSEFIDDLLNFKKLLNGKPSNFNKDGSSLYEPLPADPITIIGVLSQDFEKIVKDANNIIDLQENYSKIRKRKVQSSNHNYNLYSFGKSYRELIDLKKSWNKKSKEFIKDFIAFIWLMNGKSSKFHMERSSIIEPIPKDPKTIIGSLKIDFSELTRDAETIIKYQSSMKDKTKKTSSNYGFNMTKGPSHDDLMLSYGSSGFSRFFTRLFTPTSGGSKSSRIRRYRLSLLDKLIPLYDEFSVFQKHLVKDESENFSEANSSFGKLEEQWGSFLEMFKFVENFAFNLEETSQTSLQLEENNDKREDKKEEKQDKKEEKREEKQDKKEEKREEKSEEKREEKQDKKEEKHVDTVIDQKDIEDLKNLSDFDKAAKIISIFNSKKNQLSKNLMISHNLSTMTIYKIRWQTIHSNLEKADTDKNDLISQKEKLSKKIIDEWEKITTELFAQSNNRAVHQLEKLAQNYLSKWLGRAKHRFFSDETSASRLDCYHFSEEIMEKIDKIMDSLENGFNPVVINKLSESISNNFSEIKRTLPLLEKFRNK